MPSSRRERDRLEDFNISVSEEATNHADQDRRTPDPHRATKSRATFTQSPGVRESELVGIVGLARELVSGEPLLAKSRPIAVSTISGDDCVHAGGQEIGQRKLGIGGGDREADIFPT
jgi:hypothetical protein